MLKRSACGITTLILVAATAFLAPSPVEAQDYYWENPRFLSDPSARYPAALEVPGGIAVVWQESRSTGSNSGEAFLSLALLQDGKPEVLRRRFAGPFTFRGDEPVLLSAASSPAGELAVAVLSDEREATVLVSRDGGSPSSPQPRWPPTSPFPLPASFPARAGAGTCSPRAAATTT